MNHSFLGCIGDDFTGSSDAASFLRAGGANVLLHTGIPKAPFKASANAQVIALKSRSVPADTALMLTKKALRYLTDQGASQIYFKYCSTFDSTPQGNIGPVCDMLMETLKVPYTILCPALPVNGRTVKNGILYVNRVSLEQSPMGKHPINPMWSGSIAALMEPQSKYPCMLMTQQDLYLPPEEISKKISAFQKGKAHFYIITDCVDQKDLKQIAGIFGHLPLLTGGSGLLEYLAVPASHTCETTPWSAASGKTLILAGSCSEMMLKQIECYKKAGNPSFFISPVKYLSGQLTEEEIWSYTEMQTAPVLLYSSQSKEDRTNNVPYSPREISGALEQLMAHLATEARNRGYEKLIVCGGETSGAVTEALRLGSFRVGDSVAPGVPILTPCEAPSMRLILKSGNFGSETFLTEAIQAIRQ